MGSQRRLVGDRVDGAKPGDLYRQEYYAGHAEDMAKELSTDGPVAVSYGSFEHALETSEWTPLERGVIEHKYYVKGVGNVTIMIKGGAEEERLVSITREPGYVWRLQIRSSPTCSKPSRR
jgi:hypothetical protein